METSEETVKESLDSTTTNRKEEEENNKEEVNYSNNNETSAHDSNNNNADVEYSDHFFAHFQSMLKEVTDKRTQDSEQQTQFRAKVLNWAEEASSRICTNMEYTMQSKSEIINSKFKSIYETIQRVKKLEEELNLFKDRVGMIYSEATDKTLP